MKQFFKDLWLRIRIVWKAVTCDLYQGSLLLDSPPRGSADAIFFTMGECLNRVQDALTKLNGAVSDLERLPDTPERHAVIEDARVALRGLGTIIDAIKKAYEALKSV